MNDDKGELEIEREPTHRPPPRPPVYTSAPTRLPLPEPDPIFRHPALPFVALALIVLLGAGALLWYTSGGTGSSSDEDLDALDALALEQERRPADASPTATSTPAGALMRIVTEPSGANVSIDGTLAGLTPFRRTLAPKWYALSIEREGYAAVDTMVSLDIEQGVTLSLALIPSGASYSPAPPAEQPPIRERSPAPQTPPVGSRLRERSPPLSATGSIHVTSEPSGVPVLLDGQTAGLTPLTLTDLPPGVHTVLFDLPGYGVQAREVTVAAGERIPIRASLSPERGTLRVSVRPWGSVYIDGTLHARDTDLMYETQLSAGTHRVRITHPTLGAWEGSVEIKSGGTTPLSIDLNGTDR